MKNKLSYLLGVMMLCIFACDKSPLPIEQALKLEDEKSTIAGKQAGDGSVFCSADGSPIGIAYYDLFCQPGVPFMVKLTFEETDGVVECELRKNLAAQDDVNITGIDWRINNVPAWTNADKEQLNLHANTGKEYNVGVGVCHNSGSPLGEYTEIKFCFVFNEFGKPKLKSFEINDKASGEQSMGGFYEITCGNEVDCEEASLNKSAGQLQSAFAIIVP